MTTPSQLGTLRGKIEGLEAEKLDTKKAVAAAQEPGNIAFLRQQLGDLNKEEIVLLEQENILLQGHASDPPPSPPQAYTQVMTAILQELKFLHMQSASQGIFTRYTIRKIPSNRAKKAV